VVAFLSKFIGCALTAKITGFDWRESGAVGSLMSCKGCVFLSVGKTVPTECSYIVCVLSLVELIVLNVGLSAGILNSRVFAMFVVMAVGIF
jgi:Kef-type K+ transport system membrane component KefB